MKSKLHALLPLVAISGLTITLATPNASAATLLAKSFSGDGSDNIIGTLPDTGSSAWTGSSGFLNDGTTEGSNDRHAHLAMPATVASGETYTLTATFSGPGWTTPPGSQQFLAIGFSVGNLNQNGTASDGEGQTPQGSFGRVEVKSDGRYNAKAVGGSSSTDGDAGDPSTIGQTVSVVLDTTNVADYTVSYFWGATQIGSTYSIGVQAIDHIYIGLERPTTNTDDSYFDQVTLSGPAVPEPSAVALLGLGGLVLLRRRR